MSTSNKQTRTGARTGTDGRPSTQTAAQRKRTRLFNATAVLAGAHHSACQRPGPAQPAASDAASAHGAGTLHDAVPPRTRRHRVTISMLFYEHRSHPTQACTPPAQGGANRPAAPCPAIPQGPGPHRTRMEQIIPPPFDHRPQCPCVGLNPGWRRASLPLVLWPAMAAASGSRHTCTWRGRRGPTARRAPRAPSRAPTRAQTSGTSPRRSTSTCSRRAARSLAEARAPRSCHRSAGQEGRRGGGARRRRWPRRRRACSLRAASGRRPCRCARYSRPPPTWLRAT
mmetsp:Transcript_62421/g.171456  ORF Transcript_62421/g.171456 Transcript_62421/m.171456 type:complete len:284 (-) Transcript_62421:44-895(-)